MAFDIYEAINHEEHIMVEAGVGIGKSYAYLVPIIYYNNHTNLPVVVSTSTILLQEQLVKDIRLLSDILGIRPKVTLAKGMTHFKCQKRAIKYLSIHQEIKGWLRRWIENIKVGDRTELVEQIPEKLWEKINVKDCENIKCSHYNKCYYMNRRYEMKTTRGLILCNHDLLTVDLRKKENFDTPILSPDLSLVVIDEAHNLEDKVRNSLKETYTLDRIKNEIDKGINYLKKQESKSRNYKGFDTRTFDEIKNIFIQAIEQIKDQQKKLKQTGGDIERYYFEISEYSRNKSSYIIYQLEELYSRIDFSSTFDRRGNTQDLLEAIDGLKRLFEAMVYNGDNLFWTELNSKQVNLKKMKLVMCPKNVNEVTEKLFFNNQLHETLNFRTILTSATLTNISQGDDEIRYQYIINAINFPVENGGFISTPKDSPYNYQDNTIVYYNEELPHPIECRLQFIEKSIGVIKDLLSVTQGKTMVLFTSKSDMESVYQKLKKENLDWEIYKQEEGISQEETIKKFKEDINSILLGTGAYWEGVNIKGKALSNLIIFRLPFPVPDPVTDYKRSLKEDPLMEFNVPEMLIKLKQGVGRLIRSAEDKGIVTILDTRINDKSTAKYKDLVWDSLPMKIKTSNIEEIKTFVNENGINS